MANRFTDSRKWDDPWFRKLPCKYKAFFLFLIDKCDHAGIWKVDFESAEFHIGEPLDRGELLKMMDGRIVELGLKEKWFIPKFINFQYQVSSVSELKHDNRVHKSVLDILKKEGAYKPLKSPIQGCKDKDKDKDKDNKGGVGDFRPPTLEEISTYCKERSNHINPQVFLDHYQANGWVRGKTKIKDWKACVRTWEAKQAPPCSTCGGKGVVERDNGYGGVVRATCDCRKGK